MNSTAAIRRQAEADRLEEIRAAALRAVPDEVHTLIEEHKGAFREGSVVRNQWGGWDYGLDPRSRDPKPTVRTIVEWDSRITVYSFDGWTNTGTVHFDGNAASAILVTAVVEAYL